MLTRLVPLSLTCVLVLTGVVERAPAGEDRRVLLWKLGTAEEIDALQRDGIQDLIAAGIARRGFEVMTDRDVAKMLQLEETKLKCGSDVSCLAEIGAALGVPELVSGSLSRLGQTWVFGLQRIDPRKARVLGRAARQLQGGLDEVLAVIPGALTELYGLPPPPNDPTPPATGSVRIETGPLYPTNPYRLWGHVAFWSGLGIAALGGLMTGLAADARSEADQVLDPAELAAALNRVDTFNGLAVAGYLLGGTLLATGVVLWVLSPGDKRWAEEHGLVVAPGLGPDRAGLQVGWSF
jgi:hypothetical protein